jgi:hypothetical protein
MANKLERAAGVKSQADIMRERRVGAKDVPIGSLSPEDRATRERLEQSDEAWLRFFFPDPPYGFWYAFTEQQLAMVEAIGHAIKYGGDQAIAASRGEGKTQIARRLILKYTLSGQVRFAVLFASTGSDAADSLAAIKADIEEGELLARYYPEVCDSIRALENTPNRAHYQTVSGHRHDTGEVYFRAPSRFSWCGHEVSLPNVPGSPAAGAIIATRGLDSAVRGLNKKGRRPDVAIIDDPDTEETARSEEQAQKLEDRIDRAIGGLGGQQRSIARVMLTTLQNRTCVSYRFTDPKAKPTWKGKRFRFLLEPPTRRDLWDDYVLQVQSDLQQRDSDGEPLDPFARGAHRLYLENREAMDAGAKIANSHRFDHADLGDGTHLEESALQRYYNLVARVGPEAVATEYDNDPPVDESRIESKLTWFHVSDCAGDYQRQQVSAETNAVVRGVDVRKIELHDAVIASDPTRRYRIADYNVRSHGTSETTVEQAESLILEALRNLAKIWQDEPLMDEHGTHHAADLTLIDKGWLGNWTEDGEVKTWVQQPVELFCLEAGIDQFLPAKGAPNYQAPAPDRLVIVGDNWHINRGRGKNRICDEVIWNADHWHLLVEELFMLPDDSPDRFELFTADEGIWTNHKALGGHIESGAKQLREQQQRGTKSRKPRFVRDHWWDALAMCLVGASVLGVLNERKVRQRPRRTLAQMAGR